MTFTETSISQLLHSLNMKWDSSDKIVHTVASKHITTEEK